MQSNTATELPKVNQWEIKTEKIKQSRLEELDMDHIQFGKTFADHMFVCEYDNGAWHSPVIIPYRELELSPAISALHYGQAIFEGMKAYKNPAGEVRTFRPNKHIERLNKSAARMAMPEFPKDLFLQALRELLALDAAWVPNKNIDDALYIRPLMFAADPFLGLRPSDKFLFCIFCSPASSYYAKPIKVMLSNQYVRAFPGGVGHAKAAGNYAATMLPLKEAQSKGYDQLLWMDGVEFKFAQEIGTMNIFFMMDDRVVTPVLDGTILDGVTRRSVIELLNDRGYYVQERRIGMDEVLNAHQHGKLQDVFGTGTAATLAHISDMAYGADTINLPNVEDRLLSGAIKKQLAEIKAGLADDIHGWMV